MGHKTNFGKLWKTKKYSAFHAGGNENQIAIKKIFYGVKDSFCIVTSCYIIQKPMQKTSFSYKAVASSLDVYLETCKIETWK